MILETIRALKDALSSDNSYGVNTQIPLVDTDAGDSTPPLVVTFQDETRSTETALRRSTENRPALLFTLPDTVEFIADPMSDVRYGTVMVRVTLLYDNVDTADAKTDFLYTIRAIQRAVRVWMNNENASARSRNNIHVQSLTGMSVSQLFAPVEDGSVAGTIDLTFEVRDVEP